MKNQNYNLIGNTGLSIIFSWMSMGILFLSNVLIMNSVTLEEYGKFKYFLSIYPIIALFSFPEINLSSVNFLKKFGLSHFIDISEKRVFMTILFAFISGIFLFFLKINEKEILFFLLFIVTFYSAMDIFQVYNVVKNQFWKNVLWQFIKNVIYFLSLFLCLKIYSGFNYRFLIILFFSIPSLFNLFLYIFIRKKTVQKSKKNINKYLYTENTKNGIYLTFINSLNNIITDLDNIILSFFYSFESVALYSSARLLEPVFKVINKNLTMSIFPLLSEYENMKTGWKNIKYKLLSVFFIFFLLSVCVYFIMPLLYKFLLPERYMISLKYAQIILVYVIVLGFFKDFPRFFFIAFDELKLNIIYNLTVPVFRIVISILFALKFEIMGIIYARGISFLFAAILGFMLMKKKGE